MTLYYQDESVSLYAGDCLDVLPGLPGASVDAVVTDPPYALTELPLTAITDALSAWLAGQRAYTPKTGAGGFMGRDWDRFVPPPAAWDQCMRVLKPGGHLLAFSAPRTHDLMAMSIRLAGFEIRDSIDWIFGSGFPKSLNVSKAIDKAAGAEREVIAEGTALKRMIPGADQNRTGSWTKDNGREFVPKVTVPSTGEAARWSGWGTGLKPAHEPVILARKPFAGTVAANVLAHGTGALNIDGCRVAYTGTADLAASEGKNRHADYDSGPRRNQVLGEDSRPRAGQGNYDGGAGRWPPNVMLSHAEGCVPHGMRRAASNSHHPAQRGPSGYSGGLNGQDGLAERRPGSELAEAWHCAPGCPVTEMNAQSGVTESTASRRAPLGGSVYGDCSHSSPGQHADGLGAAGASRFFPLFRYEAKAGTAERPRLADGTEHNTVKPVDLLRWLVRLVTPPGGTVLDPFAGSGTTGEACIVEGFRSVLVERDPKSVELIMTRLRKPIQPYLQAT